MIKLSLLSGYSEQGEWSEVEREEWSGAGEREEDQNNGLNTSTSSSINSCSPQSLHRSDISLSRKPKLYYNLHPLPVKLSFFQTFTDRCNWKMWKFKLFWRWRRQRKQRILQTLLFRFHSNWKENYNFRCRWNLHFTE